MKTYHYNYLAIRLSVVPIAVVALAGCGSGGLDGRMYTVNLTDAKVPVMLSDTRIRNAGKPIEVQGLRSFESIGDGYRGIDTTKWSTFTPSEQMSILAGGSTRFVLIREISYEAEDYNMIGRNRNSRSLRIEAEVVP